MNAECVHNVGLFFYVEGNFLFHGCKLNGAETYGDFLVYPESHMDVWDKEYWGTYGVDFDYYPRGRIVYRKTDDTFMIYYDRCIGEEIQKLVDRYDGVRVLLDYDEHYQCHICNLDYVI